MGRPCRLLSFNRLEMSCPGAVEDDDTDDEDGIDD
jgi:hypothetical protein